MSEDEEGKTIVNCRTYQPTLLPSFPMLMFIKEVEEEVQVAAVEIGLLHRRLGHMGKSAMIRLMKEELVRGLEGGVAGKLGVCRGCELGKPLGKPHPPKDVMNRVTKKLELVHSTLA